MLDAKSNAPKCECGVPAVVAMAFRSARILCQKCYANKSLKFPVEEEFLIDALTVIARTTGLKATTLDALREMVIARTQL